MLDLSSVAYILYLSSAKILAHVLNNERKQPKLTQHNIAVLSAVRQPTISNFENSPNGCLLNRRHDKIVIYSSDDKSCFGCWPPF